MNNNHKQDDELLKNLILNVSPTTQADEGLELKKYWRVIWRKKYWIFLLTLLFSSLWIFLTTFFVSNIEFKSSAMIRFDDPRYSRGVSAVTDFAVMDVYSKLAILGTRSFLGRVVDSLQYNLRFDQPEINPAQIILSIDISDNARLGKYKIVNNTNYLTLSYHDFQNSSNEKVLKKIPVEQDSVVHLASDGLQIELDAAELLSYPEVSFDLLSRSTAIDIISTKIESALDRSNTILSLSYFDKNAAYSTLVVNTIADLFIQQLLDYKRNQTSSIFYSLEDQLKVAQQELELAENQLRTFRERNPFVSLVGDQQQIVSQYAALEGTLLESEKNLAILNDLVSRLEEPENGKKIFLYQDILSFLESSEVTGAAILVEQYENLVLQRQTLLDRNIPPQHPQLLSIDQQIAELEEQIARKAIEYTSRLKSEQQQMQRNVEDSQKKLRTLPRNELRLAELERNRQIKDRIVSTIMSRMEEAKVHDAAVITDAYIIDKAERPLKSSGSASSMKKMALGPILGLFLSVALFLFLDILNPTVRSTREVEKKLQIPLLAVIPIIGKFNEMPENNPDQKKLDDKLITSDYAPNMAGESFRFLRTKLNLLNHEKHHFFIVNSLSPGEGKSLISANLAITYAQQKIPTLLVDCDLRRGVLHHTFACKKEPGLSNLLLANSVINIHEASRVIQNTHVPHLFLMTCGKHVPNPSELLGGGRMEYLCNMIKNEFRAIIFDTPPLAFTPDAMVLNKFVHSLVLITRYGKTNLNHLKDVLQEFKVVKQDFVGVIVNASPELKKKEYYSYSYYHY